MAALFPNSFYQQLRDWFQTNARDLPWRGTRDPYAIMVSEFMLQQTQAATVIPYFRRWMQRFPTVESLAAATEQEVLSLWQGLGYYSRAKNLHRAAQTIALQLGSFPDTLVEMKRLPGMGDYTAGAILTFSQNARVPIVDANIARVLARLFSFRQPIDSSAGRAKIWAFAAQLLPKENAGEFNAALMELGALICTPKPKCPMCAIQSHCLAFQNGEDPTRLPIKTPKATSTQKIERALFINNGELIALTQRQQNPWQGMWVLPQMAHTPDVLEMPILTHQYGITRYRVTLEIYRSKSTSADIRWFNALELQSLPIPSPHRRALEAMTVGA